MTTLKNYKKSPPLQTPWESLSLCRECTVAATLYSKTSHHTGFRWDLRLSRRELLYSTHYSRKCIAVHCGKCSLPPLVYSLSNGPPLSEVLISTQTCIINGLGAGYGQCSNGLEVLVMCKVILVVTIYLRYIDNIRVQVLNIGNIIVSL